MHTENPCIPCVVRASVRQDRQQNGAILPLLLIVPDGEPALVYDHDGALLGDYLTLRFAQAGWRPPADNAISETWAIVAEGPHLAVSNGPESIPITDATDGPWLSRTISSGGAFVIYNLYGNRDMDPRLIANSPYAVGAFLPLVSQP